MSPPSDPTDSPPSRAHQFSFHEGPPILHYHGEKCKLVTLKRDLNAEPLLNALRREIWMQSEESSEDDETEVVIDDLDVWVASDKFKLYAPNAATGLSVPYPFISLHALMRLRVPGASDEVQGLFMQINQPEYSAGDQEESFVELKIVPGDHTDTTETNGDSSEDQESESEAQQLYNAVSACSELNPDEDASDDGADDDADATHQNGSVMAGLPGPASGSSGWITAENMHEFVDEEGNWLGEGQAPAFPSFPGAPLGAGAGNVRGREEDGDAMNEEDDGTKWQRTE
ncbi:hypothetical protein N7468_007941 [Penicillium chermesinum]|uniref:Uncharacterized protein n=1 Tax=Penicillium chermesinum TaxID=63820 RepID=A0A9W9TI72_9EURO|nr:uncharacterized protein N7468_007941 [Penicillium chermesinum]KAJ5223399.1 hypothetical protein N7468_007941 [Penicillium chermesinum]